MSDQPTANLKELLEQCNLLDKAHEIEESVYQLQAGSAMVVVGIKGPALVIISPMFKSLPEGREGEFCQRMLELNSLLGGIANFAIQPDGWVVMHGGRDVKGMDADEFAMLIGAVASAADHYDNLLLDEFYSSAQDEEPALDDEAATDEAAAEPTVSADE